MDPMLAVKNQTEKTFDFLSPGKKYGTVLYKNDPKISQL